MKKTSVFILALWLVVSLSTNVFAEGKDKNQPGNKPAPASATATLSGQVIDAETGEALTGVLVKVIGTDKEVYTDFDGNFTIKDVPRGEHDMVTKMISYQVHVDKSIRVTQGNEKKLKVRMKKK